jgi:exodeoxyribonuclease V gamma subunit
MLAGCAMFLYRSNRSERLIDALAEVVRRPLADPLAAELIVVQSKGMERWLSMQLSLRLRVWANARFPFPRHLLESLFDATPGAGANSAAWNERALMWSVLALLPSHLGDPAFAPIARYLEHDASGGLRVQLAAHIARVFDDYTVYRPELLLGWERGEESGWEAVLWRALVARLGRGHQAARAERLIAALHSGDIDRARLPERMCLFGISTLPPLYLSVLSALSARVETHLFVLSPSREYWGDVKRRRREGAAEPHGHPLLAAFGRLGREFQELLEERVPNYVEGGADLYQDPGTDSLLHTLQSDMLALRDRGAAGDAAQRAPIAPADASVQVHVCHSPMREIEVLHDQLCAVLEDPSIEPHDIAVMMPDIETYAPVIEAVFGQRSGRPQLPYSVSDRKTRSTHQVVDALYALLEAEAGRLSASSVLDLLSFDCVRLRFAIESDEVDQVRTLVEQSGIRWGVDAEHRVEVGQPAFDENTWRAGLSRMLLGYAMESRGRRLYNGVLPLEDVEGNAAQLLGKLTEFCERLFRHRVALRAPRSIAAWRDALLLLLSDMVASSPSTAPEHQLVATALGQLVDAAAGAGFDGAVELRSVLPLLERALDERLPARGLLARGITFCQLVPMRSIPFKVLCLCGMNDDVFPGHNTLLGFDRIGDRSQRRIGDRSRRDDDRYMALEALLCARERLIVTYVGRGIHDNRVIPPSVVVGELLDAVARGFSAEGGDVEARLCTLQRLHAFSPRYFDGESALFSYAGHYCEGALALQRERVDRPLLDGPLPAPPLTALTIDALYAWVTTPIRCFLQQRLGVYLGRDQGPIPEREPLALDALDRWKLSTDLLALFERGGGADGALTIARARGALPLGAVGAHVFTALGAELDALGAAVRAQKGGDKLEPLPIALDVGGVRLEGTLHDLLPRAHVCAGYSRADKRFVFGHFIRHLALNAQLARTPRAGCPRTSVVVARASKDDEAPAAQVVFAPVDDAEQILADLVELARAAQTLALPFEYGASRAYAAARLAPRGKSKAEEDPELRAWNAAAGNFEGEFGGVTDEYVRLVYPSFARLAHDDGPLGFAALARRVFARFFSSQQVAS